MHKKIPPLLLTGIFAALILLASRVFPQFTYDPPFRSVIAAVLVTIGTAICGLAIQSFFRIRTTVNPVTPEQSTSLVVEGVFRYTRNPMYLGFLMLLMAWAVFLAHIPSLLLAPPLFIGYMNTFQIIPEEEALSQIFGDDFASYRRKVRRWL